MTRPRTTTIVPRVAMKGFTRRRVIKVPLARPTAEAATSASTTATGLPSGSALTTITPDSATTEPIERSKPPPIINRHPHDHDAFDRDGHDQILEVCHGPEALAKHADPN